MSAVYRLYETGEGWVFLGCVQEKEWETVEGRAGGRVG